VTDDGGHREQVRALFEAKAVGWPGKYAPEGRLAGRLRQFAGAAAGLVPSGGELLDLGCASGELALSLADAGYRVTGCDIAPAMLRAATAADRRQTVRWVMLDPGWRSLPFESASLDAVVASSLFEYVENPRDVLRECARVLRPGGTLLCTVPNLVHPVRWLEWPLSRAAGAPLAGRAAAGWPRLASYRRYLLVSRQRRTARWWRAAGRRAGLRPAPGPRTGPPRAPLRLLTFIRPGRAGAPTFNPSEDICDHGND